jgi:hypothetical protein
MDNLLGNSSNAVYQLSNSTTRPNLTPAELASMQLELSTTKIDLSGAKLELANAKNELNKAIERNKNINIMLDNCENSHYRDEQLIQKIINPCTIS